MDNARDFENARTAQYRKIFWDRLENKVNIVVPQYVKDVFRKFHWDNFGILEMVAIDQVDDIIIHSTEKLVRKNIEDIVGDPSFDTYFHKFRDCPDSFEFEPSIRFAIKRLIKCVKDNPTLMDNAFKLSGEQVKRLRAQTGLINNDQDIESNKNNLKLGNSSNKDSITIADEIFIGDWCLFQKEESRFCLVGVILGFAYMEKKSIKNIEYSKNSIKRSENKDIGVLCQWYHSDDNGNLRAVKMDTHGYFSINHYKLTIPSPLFSEDNLTINNAVYNDIKSYLEKCNQRIDRV